MSGAERADGEAGLPGGDFRLFVHKLGFQGMIALGLVENPLTGEKEVHLGHARALVDDLMMLRDKTRGNLGAEEEQQLAKWLGDLQFHFVRASEEPVEDAGPNR